jgi:hypothetical protein
MIRITSPLVTHIDQAIKARRTVVLVADLQRKGTKAAYRPSWLRRGLGGINALRQDPISGSDRRIFVEQDDEVSDLAQKYGLSQAQIRELISRVGNDRKKLNQAFDLYFFNML